MTRLRAFAVLASIASGLFFGVAEAQASEHSARIPQARSEAALLARAALHFDSTDHASVVLADGRIVEWKSMSGSGTLRAASPKEAPEYRMGERGELSGVRFDGHGKFLTLVPENEIRLGNVSIFVVANFADTTAGQYLFGTAGEMRFDVSSGFRQFTAAIGNELAALKRGARVDAHIHLFELSHFLLPPEAGILKPGKFSIDGAVSGRPFTRSSDSISENFTFGARGGRDGFFSGDIREILIFREELSDSDARGVRAYLGEKWQVNLVDESIPEDTPRLQPVGISAPGEFASLGIYHQSPESPDGHHIAYVTFDNVPTKEEPFSTFTIWIRDTALKNPPRALKKSTDRGSSHNGIVLQWVDNDTLAYSGSAAPRNAREKTRRVLNVIDARDGSVRHGPFYNAFLGEGSFDGHILLGVEEGSNVGAPGVYRLDTRSGDMKVLFTTVDLLPYTNGMSWPGMKANPLSWNTPHPQYSPGGKRISFELGVGGGLLFFFCDADGSNLRYWGNDKPLHEIWFDDDTISGADEGVDDGAQDNLYFRRWTMDRRVVETLGGTVNHTAISPDREWVAGETFYAQTPIALYVFRRGDPQPRAVVPLHGEKVIWKDSGHVNPSFSRDGKRLYFHTSLDDHLKQVCYVDLSAIIDEFK